MTPETARLLQHWRGHRFADVRPFFCQVEAVETAIIVWQTVNAVRRMPGRACRSQGRTRSCTGEGACR